MNVYTLVILIAGILLAGCDRPKELQHSENDSSKSSSSIDNPGSREPTTNAPRQPYAPGPKGEPPPEIKSLRTPIKIVYAVEFLDGGTNEIVLRDANGYLVQFFVYQDSFPNGKFPPNALVIGDPDDSNSARLPLNEHESQLLVSSLDDARKLVQNDKPIESLPEGQGPAEAQVRDLLRNPNGHKSEEEWKLIFALDTLKRLNNIKTFPLADLNEIKLRTARLQAVDLDATCKEFRDQAGQSRSETWKRLEPVFNTAMRSHHDKQDIAITLTKLLGEPDEAALKTVVRVFHIDNGEPIDNDVFTYLIGREIVSESIWIEYLVVDFRHPDALFSHIYTEGSPLPQTDKQDPKNK